ncbi:FtsW/RodA/SpoVE family cell cycle protein, partial [Patescibacteria group bacterium]|nr:FtsW/RodA/SpoVE family cell cycle protein [Patescibacteria group bacterium]
FSFSLSLALFLFFDWHLILNYGWLIWGFYGFVNLLLLITLLFSPLTRHIHGWLSFGSLAFQPAELAKVALILVYAQYFSRRHFKINHIRVIAQSFLIFILPATLIFAEPDFGAAFILLGIWFGFLLISGLSLKRIAAFVLVFIIVSVALWGWFLKDYQKERIVSFLHPGQNALTYNYNVNQSRIAIGSAGLFGKGYNQGSQTKLGFLPEAEGDFIFASFVEQWGLAGGLFLILIFVYLIFQILKIGAEADQNFEKFICLGTVIVLSLQFFLNAGSELGILPVVGVTFPLLSYGGSSLLTLFFLISIINSIANKY